MNVEKAYVSYLKNEQKRLIAAGILAAYQSGYPVPKPERIMTLIWKDPQTCEDMVHRRMYGMLINSGWQDHEKLVSKVLTWYEQLAERDVFNRVYEEFESRTPTQRFKHPTPLFTYIEEAYRLEEDNDDPYNILRHLGP